MRDYGKDKRKFWDIRQATDLKAELESEWRTKPCRCPHHVTLWTGVEHRYFFGYPLFAIGSMLFGYRPGKKFNDPPKRRVRYG